MYGMSFEIGAGGMSAATSGRLEVGEQVILYPVIRVRAKATVRRKNGSKYGFEFVAPTPEFREMVWALCQTLPLFQDYGRHLKLDMGPVTRKSLAARSFHYLMDSTGALIFIEGVVSAFQ
jgi:hypothetical protein